MCHKPTHKEEIKIKTRDYAQEFTARVAWIKQVLADAGVSAVVFGSSGGKDATLVGILCKAACEDTLGVIMPCETTVNYGTDRDHALLLQQHFGIEHMQVSLTDTKAALLGAIGIPISGLPSANIAPRLRMTAINAIGAVRGALVAGTSNRSELYMGYFTKWGIDGVSDFNPIADLTATEVLEFLRHLEAPEAIYTKAPSAGLYEGQTDEAEMGVTYKELDDFLLNGTIGPNYHVIERSHNTTAHKRRPIAVFSE